MASQMRLFLIRHGETVDNVAQLYAGSRDSALTNHGFQQATRLGLHFDALGIRFTHLFSSHLQRAAKTAGMIRQAQTNPPSGPNGLSDVPELVQLPMLMEQDFGFYEGKKWYDKPANARLSGKEHHRLEHKDEAEFVDMESKESMAKRADAFLDEHILPLLDGPAGSKHVIAVVSHGIMLSNLWKRLLLRLPQKSVSFSPELLAGTPRFSLEHLGGWSNTGYLELHMTREVSPTLSPEDVEGPSSTWVPAPPEGTQVVVNGDTALSLSRPIGTADTEEQADEADLASSPAAPVQQVPRMAHGWNTLIQTVNGKDHMKGLKRTGGGVGSSRHDTSQKNIDSFFKRRKVD